RRDRVLHPRGKAPVATVHSKVHLPHAERLAVASRIPSGTVQTAEGDSPKRAARIRRRDRHGRGLRGALAPPDVPLYPTRRERFDALARQAVARLDPQWGAPLSGVECAVEEIPPLDEAADGGRGPVPLSRLEPGSPRSQPPGRGGDRPDGPAAPRADRTDGAARADPPPIAVYRRAPPARCGDAKD